MIAAELLTKATNVHERALPFLQPGDDWRPDADGVPPLEDVLRAWGRVMGERPTASYPMRFYVNVFANEYEVGTPVTGEFCTGATPAEAALELLELALDHVCAECKVWDGHDHHCGHWRTEQGQSDLEGAIGDPHHCPGSDVFSDAPGTIVQTVASGGRESIQCIRCGWPFIEAAS